MAETDPEALSDEATEGLRNYSCFTTPPDRAIELFEAATRQGCPVAHSDEYDGYYMLLRYADVKGGMANPAVFSSQPKVTRPLADVPPVPSLEMDPPRQKEWRTLFDQPITPHSVKVMEGGVRAEVDVRIDGFITRGSADLVNELAETIPVDTICRLIGVGEEMAPVIREKALALLAASNDPEKLLLRMGEFGEVTLTELHKRDSEPRDDYLTYMTTVEVEGRRLDDEDFIGLLASFLLAGHHTTTSAMASVIYEVFRDEDVRDRLLADSEAIPIAIEEALRLHPPLYGFFRRTTQAVEVAGVEIPDGEDVYMGWASANRDPEMFPDPTEFKLDRGRNRHLTFGFGVHSCPGAPLARMELRVVIEKLLERLPDLKIAGTPEYVFGGAGDYSHIVKLPVTFEARPAANP